MTSHPTRSKRLSNQAQSKLHARQWMTWREIASMDHYRQRIPELWPDDKPELYDYRILPGLIDRRSIIEKTDAIT